MQIETSNPDLFFVLLYKKYSIAVIETRTDENNIVNFYRIDIKDIDQKGLEKYKVLGFKIVNDPLPQNLEYRTINDYNPRSTWGMICEQKYKKIH